jgi:lipocalin
MKYTSIILLLAVSSLILSCNKENKPNLHGIIIKGKIPSGISKKVANGNASYTLADAEKILVFNSSGSYDIFNIKGSSFTVNALQGTAAAMVFLTAENSYIGCLHAGGLNVLPLVSLKDGENTVIDLSNLTLEGTNVIPSNNPIGNEINLTNDEIERYRQFGAFFQSLSQNTDADDDGKLDLLDQKALFISTIYDIYCGMWGLNNSSPEIIDPSTLFVNYTIRIWGQKSIIPVNKEVTFSGPEGAPYGDIQKSYYTNAPDGFITFFRRPAPAPYPIGTQFLPFENGKYDILLDSKKYSLLYSKVDAEYFFVLALPVVHTNDNNEITSISIEYKDIYGQTINPENFVYQTMVQLNNEENQLEQIGALWESPEAKTNTELYNYIPVKKINVSQLTGINVCYLDLVGNSYNINFKKH